MADPLQADLLDDLLDRWEAAQVGGATLTPEELCAEDPGLQAELRRRLAVLTAFDLLRPTQAETLGEAVTALPAVPGYVIERELGRGGMGVVYLARQEALGRTVALKFLPFTEATATDYRQRFQQEAQALAHLQHPHIVQVFEVGAHESRPFMALEYVGGGTLAQAWNRRPQEPRQVAALLETVARAIAYAHSRGVLHRDLKPANILLASPGRESGVFFPKVSDFGLAKLLADSDLKPQAQTQSGSVMGTPSYMAPEQAKGDTPRIGPAADVYGLGAILYEGLTGRPPFESASLFETVQQVVTLEPKPPRKLTPAVPLDLETITLRCLRKELGQRFASALDLAEELGRFLRGEPILSRPVSALERGRRWVSRNPVVAGLMGLAALALIAVAIVSLVFAQHARQSADSLSLALADAQKQVAQTDRLRGLALCEKGDVPTGLHWLVKALEETPPKATDLAAQLQAELHGWSRQTPRLLMQWQVPNANQVNLAHDGCYWHAVAGNQLFVGSFIEPMAAPVHAAFPGMVLAATSRPGLPPSDELWIAVAAPNNVHQTELHRVRDGIKWLYKQAAQGRWQPHSTQKISRFTSALLFSPSGEQLAHAQLPPPPFTKDSRLELSVPDQPDQKPMTWDRTGHIVSMCYSADGQTLAVLLTRPFQDNTSELCLLDPATAKLKADPIALPEPALLKVTGQLFIPPDGQTVWVATGAKLRCFDLTTRKLLEVLPAPMHGSALAFTPDGGRFFRADGGSVRGHGRTGDPAGAPMAHDGGVRSMATFDQGRYLLTACEDGRVRLWETGQSEHWCNGQVTALAFQSGSERVAGGTATGWGFEGSLKAFAPALLRTSGQAAGADREVVFYDRGEKLIDFCLRQRVSLMIYPAWADFPVVSVGQGRRIDRLARRFDAGPPWEHPAYVHTMGMLPGDRRLCTGCADGQLRLWGARRREELALKHSGQVRAFGLRGKDELVVVSDEEVVRWSWPKLEERVRLPLQGVGVLIPQAVAMAPNGDWAALRGNRDDVILVNVGKGTSSPLPIQFPGGALAVCFIPGTPLLAIGGDSGKVVVFDCVLNEVRWTLTEHTQRTGWLAAGTDGRFLYTGSDDRTLRQWDIASGRRVGVPLLLAGRVSALQADPEDKGVLVGTFIGQIRWWPRETAGNVSSAEWRRRVEGATGTRLTSSGELEVLLEPEWWLRQAPATPPPHER